MIRLAHERLLRSLQTTRWALVKRSSRPGLRHQTTLTRVGLIRGSTWPNSIQQSRFLSTETSVVVDDELLEDVTQTLLDRSQMPLGRMSESELESAIEAIRCWCATNSGYGVYTADHLLRRVLQEHAVGTFLVRQYTPTLVEVQLLVLQSWMQLGSVDMAMKNSENILYRLIEWYNNGRSEYPPDKEVEAFVQLCLKSDSATSRATNLLLRWTDHPHAMKNEVLPLFHATLEQCTEHGDTVSASLLSGRMEELEKRDTLFNDETNQAALEIPLQVDEYHNISLNFDKPQLVVDSQAPPNELSAFEQDALQRPVVSFLESATKNDIMKVQELLDQVDRSITTTELSQNLCQNAVRYFTRQDDVKQAFQWLRRLDDITVDKAKLPADCFLGVLQLWANGGDADTPWRAQEIVARMEILEPLGFVGPTTGAYNFLMQAWLKNAEPIANTKVQHTFTRMLNAKASGSPLKGPSVDSYAILRQSLPNNEDSTVEFSSVLVGLFHGRGLSDVDRVQLSNVVETVVDALTFQEKADDIENFLQSAASAGVPIGSSLCVKFINYHSLSTDHMNLVRAMGLLEQTNHKSMPLKCYEEAIRNLLHKRPFKLMRGFLATALNKRLERRLSYEFGEMEKLVEYVIVELQSQRRVDEAEEILSLVESRLIASSPDEDFFVIPVTCFDHVMLAWHVAGDIDKSEDTFNRVLSHYRSGTLRLVPNCTTFVTYVQARLEKSQDHRSVIRTAWALAQSLTLYQSTENDLFVPPDTTFVAVFNALEKLQTKNATTAMVKLLHCLIDSRCRRQDLSFPFTRVMRALLARPDAETYKTVTLLADRMHEVDYTLGSVVLRTIIDACSLACDDQKEEALVRAASTMGRLRKEAKPNAESYRSFLNTMGKLLENDNKKRETLVAAAFQMCVDDKVHIDDRLRTQFQAMMDHESWKRLNSYLERGKRKGGIKRK